MVQNVSYPLSSGPLPPNRFHCPPKSLHQVPRSHTLWSTHPPSQNRFPRHFSPPSALTETCLLFPIPLVHRPFRLHKPQDQELRSMPLLLWWEARMLCPLRILVSFTLASLPVTVIYKLSGHCPSQDLVSFTEPSSPQYCYSLGYIYTWKTKEFDFNEVQCIDFFFFYGCYSL